MADLFLPGKQEIGRNEGGNTRQVGQTPGAILSSKQYSLWPGGGGELAALSLTGRRSRKRSLLQAHPQGSLLCVAHR